MRKVSGQRARTREYISKGIEKVISRASARFILESIEHRASSLAAGETGIYLSPYVEWQCEKWIQPLFDIDGVKKDPVSAIQRAQAIDNLLAQGGLSRYVLWLLSGTGLRAIFLFLIPFELRGGFIRFMKSLSEHGVDYGPYESIDPPPMRLLCYRGHSSQKGKGGPTA